MKIIIALITSSIILSGCQLMGGNDSTDIANADFNNMSCKEIKETFDSYKSTIDNADTATGLLSAVGVNSGTNEAKSLMKKTYHQAKKTATPIMKSKQCKERI